DLGAGAGEERGGGHLDAHHEVGGGGLVGGDGGARGHPEEVGAADVAVGETLFHARARFFGGRVGGGVPAGRDGDRRGPVIGGGGDAALAEDEGRGGALAEPVGEDGGEVGLEAAAGGRRVAVGHVWPGLRIASAALGGRRSAKRARVCCRPSRPKLLTRRVARRPLRWRAGYGPVRAGARAHRRRAG